MDTQLLRGFIEEAENFLPQIRQSIETYSSAGNSHIEELKAACRQIHTIKGAAMMFGLKEISDFAQDFQTDLNTIILLKSEISDERAAELTDKSHALKKMFDSIDITTFGVENDFSQMPEFEDIPEPEIVNQDIEVVEPETEDFEIDEEMLEVFAMEAEEHLRNITTHLNFLEQNPSHEEALLEIRRSSHTLKGSAGIVGFKKLSDLAHVQEDLLDYLAENPGKSNTEIFKLLLASTDCLEALSNGQSSLDLDEQIAELHVRFREILKNLQSDTMTVKATVSDVEEYASSAADMEDKHDDHLAVTAQENAQTAAQNRAVIRVSLERLDELVKLVSEMIMSRSVFEQRLLELEQQVEELHNSSRRLSRLSGKFETDLGAKAVGFNNFPNANSTPFSFPNKSFSGHEVLTQEFDFLEFDRYTEFHHITRELTETSSDTNSINTELNKLLGNLNLVFGSQRRLFEDMQDKLLRLRMVPFSTLMQRLQRTVRVTADEEGKEVDFEIKGSDLEIDSEILQNVVEPVLHLLRNAVAHGIESAEVRKMLGKSERGKITLHAYSEGTHVVFNVIDDGRGISAEELKKKALAMNFVPKSEIDSMTDEEAFSLIFLPGLSTSSEVNQVSGRGVGMNVVKSSLARCQGSVTVKSEPQKGTRFTLRLPTSLSVTRVLLVKAKAQTFAFPLKIVRQVTEISQLDFDIARTYSELGINGKNYKLIHLNELLNLAMPKNYSEETRVLLMLIDTPQDSYALAVERILKPEEIVIKPLGSPLKNVSELIGATILGDGSVVPVLDLISLLHNYKTENNELPEAEVKSEKSQPKVLIVDDSPSVRQINQNLIKNAGWEAITAKDGLEAIELLQSLGNSLPDIVLTDVEMPRMDGYELLAAIRREERLRDLPVIMITSRGGEKHRRKAYDLGVSEYLTKPYDDTGLVEKIKILAKIH